MPVARVQAVISAASGLPGLNTFYFGVGAVATVPEATDIAARVRAFWESFKANLAVGVVVDVDPTVETFDTATGALLGITAATAPAQVVSTGANSLPRATMMGLRLNTSLILANRLLKGRSFVGPLVQGTNNNGQPTAAARTALLTAGALLQTGATAAVLSVWHRPVNSAGGNVGPVVVLDVDTRFWVLRSRRD